MPDVALKPIDTPPTPDGYVYYNMIIFGDDAPLPPKPTPKPPIDPDLKPTHPIMLPGMPGWPETPTPEPVLIPALVSPPAAGDTVPTAPAADASWVRIKIKDGKATWALVNPYAAPV